MRITDWTDRNRAVRDHGEVVASIFRSSILRRTGDPDAACVCKVWARFPKDGAGTVRVVVWTSAEGGHCYAGSAGGYGYDKLTAAIADSGAVVDTGRKLVRLTDHCQPGGVRWNDRPALEAVGLRLFR